MKSDVSDKNLLLVHEFYQTIYKLM